MYQILYNLNVKSIVEIQRSYVNPFLSSGVYESFEKNLEVLDEGKNLGVKYLVSYETCESFCESTLGCESFVHCKMSDANRGNCWLKDKILHGTEPTRNNSNGSQCTSYFKVYGI